MKNTGNNNKIIAVLLAVIALCMVCIVALMVRINQPANNSATVEQGKVQSEEVTATKNPYYHYDGELSETPITPTEVENIDRLDYCDYYMYGKDLDYREAYKEEILRVASEYEVYANPTILEEFMPDGNVNGVVVDLHTANNEMLTIQRGMDKQGNKTFISTVAPIDYDSIYKNGDIFLLNFDCLRVEYMRNLGMTDAETDTLEKLIVDAIAKKVEDDNTTTLGPYMYLETYFCSDVEKLEFYVVAKTYSSEKDVDNIFVISSVDVNEIHDKVTHHEIEERSEINYRKRYEERAKE